MNQETLDKCLTVLLAARIIKRSEIKPKRGPTAMVYSYARKTPSKNEG